MMRRGPPNANCLLHKSSFSGDYPYDRRVGATNRIGEITCQLRSQNDGNRTVCGHHNKCMMSLVEQKGHLQSVAKGIPAVSSGDKRQNFSEAAWPHPSWETDELGETRPCVSNCELWRVQPDNMSCVTARHNCSPKPEIQAEADYLSGIQLNLNQLALITFTHQPQPAKWRTRPERRRRHQVAGVAVFDQSSGTCRRFSRKRPWIAGTDRRDAGWRRAARAEPFESPAT